jgi:hypothetical protein
MKKISLEELAKEAIIFGEAKIKIKFRKGRLRTVYARPAIGSGKPQKFEVVFDDAHDLLIRLGWRA